MSGFQVKVNCTLHWAFLNKPADMSGKYEVILGNLSDAAVTNLTGAGINVKTREDRPEQGRYIVCRSTHPIVAYDESGGEIKALVGNGSRATAVVGSYEWAGKTKKGVSPSLRKLVVTNLIEVQRKDVPAL